MKLHPLDAHVAAIRAQSIRSPGAPLQDYWDAAAVLRMELTREPSEEEINATHGLRYGDALKAAMAARLRALGLDK